jgi:predicted aspartyl protease
LKILETRVTITNNQIIVPVSFSNGGLEAATQLILDTGATHTVIYRSFASQLNILSLAKGQSKVASGQSVFSEVGKVDSMKVGPIQARDFPVIIMSFEGPPTFYSGLLGMDFLSRVEYVLDYENQVIRWKLRGN